MPSKYTTRKSAPAESRTAVGRRSSPRRRSPIDQAQRPGHARVEFEGAAVFGRLFDPAAALLLAIIQWSGTRWAGNRKGWIFFDQAARSVLGLTEKSVHCRAAKKLAVAGMIETRYAPGSLLEYRLNPNWAKPKAEVISLVKQPNEEAG